MCLGQEDQWRDSRVQASAIAKANRHSGSTEGLASSSGSLRAIEAVRPGSRGNAANLNSRQLVRERQAAIAHARTESFGMSMHTPWVALNQFGLERRLCALPTAPTAQQTHRPARALQDISAALPDAVASTPPETARSPALGAFGGAAR